MSNYVISNAAGLLSATVSKKTDFQSNIITEPKAVGAVNQDLSKADLPSLEKTTSQVVTFTSYGITTTLEASSRTSNITKISVPSENRNWTINSTEQCQALDKAFDQKFTEQYPGKRNPFGAIDAESLKGHIGKQKEIVILFSDNGKVQGNLMYDQEQKLADEYKLMHDPDFSHQARLMVYKQLVVERGFIGRDGNPLAFEDIGGKNDANGDGNHVTRGEANSSGLSRASVVLYHFVYGFDYIVAYAVDGLSGSFVRALESKS
jgi:hypothetical protein